MPTVDITHEPKGVFWNALDASAPGDEILYHIGHHASGSHKADALAASTAGMCFLYQRRAEGGFFAYFARKPKK